MTVDVTVGLMDDYAAVETAVKMVEQKEPMMVAVMVVLKAD